MTALRIQDRILEVFIMVLPIDTLLPLEDCRWIRWDFRSLNSLFQSLSTEATPTLQQVQL